MADREHSSVDRRQVFISHAGLDRGIARDLCEYLEASGLRCWVAPRDIHPGRDYAVEIVDAIDNCNVVLLVFSRNADIADGVRREVKTAVGKAKPVVTFRIEDHPLGKSLEFFLGDKHWLDAFDQGPEVHFDRLKMALVCLLESPVGAHEQLAENLSGRCFERRTPRYTTPPSRWQKRYLIAATVALLTAMVVTSLWIVASNSSLILPTESPAEVWDQEELRALLSDPSVKLVALDFYAAWCRPCKDAIPQWKRLSERYRERGLRVIVVSDEKGMISLDDEDWSPDRVILDRGGAVASRMHVSSYPSYFLYSESAGVAPKVRTDRVEVNPVSPGILEKNSIGGGLLRGDGLGVRGPETTAETMSRPKESVTESGIDWVWSDPAARYFARSETTLAQYKACLHSGSCDSEHHKTRLDDNNCNWGYADRAEHPMNCVDWHGAMAFCEWAGGRLPTEEEWYLEASNAGTRVYAWGGEEPSCRLCIMSDNSFSGCGVGHTWPVCSKSSGNSSSGLCDMTGSVWEWTSSWYNTGRTTRVLRGGAWGGHNRDFLRVADRIATVPSGGLSGFVSFGFRCVRSSHP